MSKPHYVPKKKNPIVKTLQWIAISAVSILLIGYFLIIDTAGTQGTPVIGSVDGKPIYYSRDSVYGRSYLQLIENYKSFGIEPNEIVLEYIDTLAFRTAVRSILLEDLAKKNINVSDEFIVNAMKSQFVGTNGIFNQAQYDNFLRQSTQSEKSKVQKDIENSIQIGTIESELFNKVKTSNLEKIRETAKVNTKRNIEMYYIDVASMVANKEIPQEDMENFFNANKTNFVQANISLIAVDENALARELHETLSTNIALFADLATTNSLHPSKEMGGKFGYITEAEFPSLKVSEIVFSESRTNILLDIIYDNDIAYIVHLDNIKVPDASSNVLASVLMDEYLSKNIDTLLSAEKENQVNILKSAMADNSLLGVGAKYYKNASPFYYGQDRILDADNNLIPELAHPDFYNYIFATEVGATTDVIKFDNGVAVIKIISEIKPSKESLMVAADTKADVEGLANRVESQWTDNAISKAKVKRNDLN